MVKRVLNISLAIKMTKLNLYVHLLQKWACIEQNLMWLNENNELLEKNSEIWEKVKNSIKKEFDCKSVYNKKYLKAKINSYNGKINTSFHNNKILRDGSQFICLSVISIDSVFRTGKNYYLKCF